MKTFRVFIFIMFCVLGNVEVKGQYIMKIYVSDESTEFATLIEGATVLIDNKISLKTGTDGFLAYVLPTGKHTVKVSHRIYDSVEFTIEEAATCLVTLNKKNKTGRSGYIISTDNDRIQISDFYTSVPNKADSLYSIGEELYDKYLDADDEKESDMYYTKAISFFKQAADMNHEEALLRLSEYYNRINSPEEALHCFQKAADLGNLSAIYNLGCYYKEKGDYSLAMELFKKGADSDDPSCQMSLAEMYEKGLGVEKNMEAAIMWYQKFQGGVNNDASLPSSAQSTKPLPTLPSQKRIALIIGNSDYQTGRLVCVGKDVKDMKKKLEELGFETMFCPNVELMEFLKSISSFCKKAREGEYDAMLFYYAGHGVQCQGDNYLIPIGDFYDDDILIKKMYVGMNDILNETAKTDVKTRIFILDACREQPISFTRGFSKGLVGLGNTPGVFMAYSTLAGKTAKDNGGDGNSPYIKELLKELDVPQRPINDVFENVKRRVSQQTGGKQQPSHINDLDVSDNEVIYLNRNNH